jgi:ABC-type multidrug transport system ATPase subunit
LTCGTSPDASAGEAFAAGASILDAPAEVRRRIGYVPQMLSADGMLTGRENLVFSDGSGREALPGIGALRWGLWIMKPIVQSW